jgi:hypothetical protein
MRTGIVPRAEAALIIIMCLAVLLIAQQWSFPTYQFGLLVLMAATVLNIAVGNLPRSASAGRAVMLTGGILLIVAAVFGAGILLVPYLATLGR